MILPGANDLKCNKLLRFYSGLLDQARHSHEVGLDDLPEPFR